MMHASTSEQHQYNVMRPLTMQRFKGGLTEPGGNSHLNGGSIQFTKTSVSINNIFNLGTSSVLKTRWYVSTLDILKPVYQCVIADVELT
jgi:hypothetical protein